MSFLEEFRESPCSTTEEFFLQADDHVEHVSLFLGLFCVYNELEAYTPEELANARIE